MLERLPGQEKTQDVTGVGYFGVVYNAALTITVVLAFIMIVIGGIEYMTSFANPGAKGEATKRITGALTGLVLALVSWLILNTINPALVNPKLGLTQVTSPTGGAGGAGAGTFDQNTAKNYLENTGQYHNVSVKNGAVLEGVKVGTLDAVLSLADACAACFLQVTDATNPNVDHDPNAGHPQGEAVDVSLNPGINDYITGSVNANDGKFRRMPPSGEKKYERYLDTKTGAVWMKENDHWDVKVR